MSASTAKNTTTTTAPQAKQDLMASQAAVWHAIAKLADKEAKARRDDLPPGYAAQVDLHLAAQVNGNRLIDDATVNLSVGHDSPRAGTGPGATDLLAWVLTKAGSPEVTAKVLGDLVSDFASGELPADKAVAAQVEAVLKVVRQSRQTMARGNVSAQVLRPETNRLNVYG